MASGQIVGVCLISMFLVCSAIGLVGYFRGSHRIKKGDPADRFWPGSAPALQTQALPGEDGEPYIAFKDRWNDKARPTMDANTRFTDRSFS